jgi:hypothetical protein
MKLKIALVGVGAALLMGALPVLAHHSFAAEYDQSKRVTFTGTFVKMDWVNPHSWVYFNVKDETGKVTLWKAETPPPNILYRNGWRQTSLKEGETVTISGNLAKDASNLMWAGSVQLSDGRVLSMGSSPDDKK